MHYAKNNQTATPQTMQTGTKLIMYDSESRVNNFLDRLYDSKDHQNAVSRATTVEEICKIAEEVEAPIDPVDLILFYRDLDHEFFPWHGMPKQKRREFIHEGRFKDGEEQVLSRSHNLTPLTEQQ